MPGGLRNPFSTVGDEQDFIDGSPHGQVGVGGPLTSGPAQKLSSDGGLSRQTWSKDKYCLVEHQKVLLTGVEWHPQQG